MYIYVYAAIETYYFECFNKHAKIMIPLVAL